MVESIFAMCSSSGIIVAKIIYKINELDYRFTLPEPSMTSLQGVIGGKITPSHKSQEL